MASASTVLAALRIVLRAIARVNRGLIARLASTWDGQLHRMEDYVYLVRKLMWVQDHPDPLQGESLPLLQEAITRLSRGGPLFVSLLSPHEARELPRLCDAVAAETATHGGGNVAPRFKPGRRIGGFWRRHRG